VPDLAGGTDQVGVIQVRRDIVFVGLGEEPTETQGIFEERQGDIERLLPLLDPQRNLPATQARADVIVTAHAEGIEAERLLPLASDGNDDRGPFNTVWLPTEQLPVGVEHYMQMRPGIDAVPSRVVLRHGLLHSLWLWAVPTFFRAPPRNSALRLRVTEPEHTRPDAEIIIRYRGCAEPLVALREDPLRLPSFVPRKAGSYQSPIGNPFSS